MTIPLFNIDLFILVFMRMSGAILFNPMLGRNNVPVTLRGGISLLAAFVVMPTLTAVNLQINGPIPMVVSCLLEFAVGFGLGTIVQIIFSVVLLAGEMIDMQMGLAMSQIYDPHSGINMPILGSFFNVLMVIVFFAANAHLTLLTLIGDSYRAIPPGSVNLSSESFRFIVLLGRDMLELGLRMAIPVLAVELICVVAIGMLMRAVPQINIFSVGIQIQAIIGIVVVVISIPVIVPMCDRLISFMIEKMSEYLRLLAPS